MSTRLALNSGNAVLREEWGSVGRSGANNLLQRRFDQDQHRRQPVPFESRDRLFVQTASSARTPQPTFLRVARLSEKSKALLPYEDFPIMPECSGSVGNGEGVLPVR